MASPIEEQEEPPGSKKPPHPWEEVPPGDWNDWRWQLRHRLRTLKEFTRVLDLTAEEVAGLSTDGHFRVGVTPYFASLMDRYDSHCPIRRQVVPTAQELVSFDGELEDSLSEEEHSPVRGLVHRYPDRVLMLVNTQCAGCCRHCTRSRMVEDPQVQFTTADYERQLAYIARTPQIRDVLLSGGDPLMLPQKVLEGILARLRVIPHVEIVRIGTRVPVFLPQRIDQALVDMLRRYHPLWMNIHFNHPKEITPEVEKGLALLADGGIPLGSQTVLLAGINDCPNVMKALMHKLLRNRVRPYYLYQCDLVRGAGHFRTPVGKGVEIMEALRGHTSGISIPTYVIDMPLGGGKVPIGPNYLISMSTNRVVTRNFQGFISAYSEPCDYKPHDSRACPYCQSRQVSQHASGVAGLLACSTELRDNGDSRSGEGSPDVDVELESLLLMHVSEALR